MTEQSTAAGQSALKTEDVAAIELKLEHLMARLNSRPRLVLAALAGLFAIQISPWWYSTPDASAYLSIARSIASGGPLANLSSPHLAYPIGYPLIVSPAFLVSARPFVLISIIHWLLALALMLGIYRWSSRQAPRAALLITALVMSNVSLWNYYHRTLSELAFMAVAIWTVQAFNEALEAREGRGSVAWLAVASVLLVLLSQIREVGVLFGGGFGIAILIRALAGRIGWGSLMWRGTIAILPAALSVLVFMRYDQGAAEKAAAAHAPVALGTHVAGFVDPSMTLAARLDEGSRLRLSEIGRLIVPGMFKTYGRRGQWLNANMLVFVPVVAIVAVGWWRLLWARREVYAATLPLYFVLYVLWAFDADTRYLLPMIPVLFASLWYAIEPFWHWRLMLMAAMLAVHLGVSIGYWLSKEVPRARECNRHWPAVERLAAAVRRDSTNVVAIGIPECVRLMMVFSLDRAIVAAPVAANNADWAIVPSDATEPASFASVATAGDYRLIRRR
jgi:hypothetical protein